MSQLWRAAVASRFVLDARTRTFCILINFGILQRTLYRAASFAPHVRPDAGNGVHVTGWDTRRYLAYASQVVKQALEEDAGGLGDVTTKATYACLVCCPCAVLR
jgi:hypothetical protein